VKARGVALFGAACAQDLEGIVAKMGARAIRDRRRVHILAEDQEPGLLAVGGSARTVRAAQGSTGAQPLTVACAGPSTSVAVAANA
jgi:hypothetical protein